MNVWMNDLTKTRCGTEIELTQRPRSAEAAVQVRDRGRMVEEMKYGGRADPANCCEMKNGGRRSGHFCDAKN